MVTAKKMKTGFVMASVLHLINPVMVTVKIMATGFAMASVLHLINLVMVTAKIFMTGFVMAMASVFQMTNLVKLAPYFHFPVRQNADIMMTGIVPVKENVSFRINLVEENVNTMMTGFVPF